MPALAHVAGAGELAKLNESAAQSPAVYVVYDGERLGEASHDGARQIVFQRWLVVLFARHAAQDGGAALRALAGERLAEIVAALAGYRPDPIHPPLQRVNAPRPGYTPAAGWFPLAYEARLIIPVE